MSVCDQLTCCFPLSVAIPANQTVMNSDNFSFQNIELDKKVHMLENNGFYGKTVGFWGKQWVFKAMFLTRLHTCFILIIKHTHFIKIQTIHVLHKLSFHNTFPHRNHSLIGHVFQEH